MHSCNSGIICCYSVYVQLHIFYWKLYTIIKDKCYNCTSVTSNLSCIKNVSKQIHTHTSDEIKSKYEGNINCTIWNLIIYAPAVAVFIWCYSMRAKIKQYENIGSGQVQSASSGSIWNHQSEIKMKWSLCPSLWPCPPPANNGETLRWSYSAIVVTVLLLELEILHFECMQAGQNSYVLVFDLAPPPGAQNVGVVWESARSPYSAIVVTVLLLELETLYFECMQAGQKSLCPSFWPCPTPRGAWYWCSVRKC